MAAPRPAAADPGLDLRAWLDSPGVRLLAVGFYSGGCEACAKAVPDWMRLYDRYHGQGLRVVLVSVPDAEGDCATPEWDPDEVVCDQDGKIAQSLGADCSSPGVYLWDWRGDLLVSKGHVCDVDAATESYLRRKPRVLLEGDQDGLADLLAQELWRAGKLAFPTSVPEHDEMQKMVEGEGTPSLDEGVRCASGTGLSRNGLLKASRAGQRFYVRLFSIENGCMVEGADVAWAKGKGPAEAVGRLLRRLRRSKMEMPQGAAGDGHFEVASVVRPPTAEAGGEGWAPEGPRRMLVRFESDPADGIVLVDGDLICQATPCAREVSRSRVQVTMDKEEYVQRTEIVELRNGQTLRWKLAADFGLLTVKTEPPGLLVELDGEVEGESPVTKLRLKSGREARVVVKDRCFEDIVEYVRLENGEEKTLRLKPKAKPSGIDLSVEGVGGDAVAAGVWVDGRRVGTTPGLFRVPLCSKEVLVRHSKLGETRAALDLEERQTRRVRLVIGRPTPPRSGESRAAAGYVSTTGKAGLEWVHLPSGSFRMGASKKGSADEMPHHHVDLGAFEIARTEVTVTQYRSCVAAGACKKPDTGKYCNFHRSDSELHPVNCVDWSRAKAFCAWVGGRLPTEAEWEYAARSGGKARLYPWGEERATCKKAIMDFRREGCWKERTWPVCSKNGNTAQGLCDMAGNAWEWVADWYDEGYYRSSPREDPKGPPVGSYKVLRGGSFATDASALRTTARGYAPPRLAIEHHGFRCVRDKE